MKTLDRKDMPAVKITIEVDEPTASAYRKASPDVKQAAQKKAAEIIRMALMSREERADEFDRFTAQTGAHARAKGWTDEMNEALLRGDYDHE